MERRVLVAAGVACLVLLAGCGGAGPNAGTDTTDATGAQTGAPTTGTTAATTAGTTAATTTGGTSTATTTQATTVPSWSAPVPPNWPFQNHVESGEDRITSVEVVEGSFADGSATVLLNVTANTSMPHVDPPEKGSVRGEPFFLAYVNSTTGNDTGFEGMLIERTPQVLQQESGQYSIRIYREALEEAGVESGQVEITVLLMDEDSEYDDIYAIERITLEYEAANGTSTDS